MFFIMECWSIQPRSAGKLFNMSRNQCKLPGGCKIQPLVYNHIVAFLKHSCLSVIIKNQNALKPFLSDSMYVFRLSLVNICVCGKIHTTVI
ncbi:hypothetical protein XELAEV_18033624mg [Xenopus laevis]|uniref:Uncharacterized protein n=1 Tax=Xenopus laevis TaxID=8355 RepID=A0A974CKB0_XENLA|nr:hypothetical protein XELAEV_18033624mg [Xenopus laevis]